MESLQQFVKSPSDGGWHSGTLGEIADQFVREQQMLSRSRVT